ncbi:hypothetical protein H696_04381 [Fonticula alba]|uniref:Uncharacterized protein n=1 Tax=Fonticula alba TaxID=691883 RepID=A0A058Z650_FONAL|nr:hypothetical protein H696_04381 [Fonticula alba]KCV68962.1 hypothetical protein H696_04381 [Fonticula alba]|eukprot:XP_009496533.1 hypothetical protein H696_04381 [Fonticula alba]
MPAHRWRTSAVVVVVAVSVVAAVAAVATVTLAEGSPSSSRSSRKSPAARDGPATRARTRKSHGAHRARPRTRRRAVRMSGLSGERAWSSRAPEARRSAPGAMASVSAKRSSAPDAPAYVPTGSDRHSSPGSSATSGSWPDCPGAAWMSCQNADTGSTKSGGCSHGLEPGGPRRRPRRRAYRPAKYTRKGMPRPARRIRSA